MAWRAISQPTVSAHVHVQDGRNKMSQMRIVWKTQACWYVSVNIWKIRLYTFYLFIFDARSGSFCRLRAESSLMSARSHTYMKAVPCWEYWKMRVYTENREKANRCSNLPEWAAFPAVFSALCPFSDIHVTPRIHSLLQPRSSRHRVDGDSEVRLFKVRMLCSRRNGPKQLCSARVASSEAGSPDRRRPLLLPSVFSFFPQSEELLGPRLSTVPGPRHVHVEGTTSVLPDEL